MMGSDKPQSIAGLLGGIMDAVNGLVRNEFDLARAEMTESTRSLGLALGLFAVALIVGFVALNVLTGALIGAIVEAGLAPGWAALLVGLVYALAAGILVSISAGKLRTFSLAPKRTARNLKKDLGVLKGADK